MSHPLIRARKRNERINFGQIQQELVLTRAPKATDPIAPELDTLAVFARLFPPQQYVTEPIVNGIREAYRQIHPHLDLPVAVKGKHPKPLENILAYYYGYGSGDPDRSIAAFWYHAHGYAPNGGPLPEIHRYPSLEGRGGYMMLAICPDAPTGRGKAIMADLGKCYPLYRVKATNGLSGQTLRFLGQEQLIFPGMPTRKKERWQQTKDEFATVILKHNLIEKKGKWYRYVDNQLVAVHRDEVRNLKDSFGAGHRYHVEKALSEGKAVPRKVLADYPDLAPAADLSGEVLHCGAWAMNEETGLPYCVAFAPACGAATGFPVISPVEIAKFQRRLKDSGKAIDKTKAEISRVKEGPSTRGQAKKLDQLRLTLNAAYDHYQDASWHLRRASGHFEGLGAKPMAATRKLKKVCIGWREVHSKYYNKKIWKCDEYARPTGEGACLVEPAAAPFSKGTIKSLAKWYAETWNEEFEWRTPGFIKEIRDRGGIRPYKERTRAGKVDEEYMQNVPLFLRRKKGLPPDEMASEMGFDTDSDLYEAISEVYGAGKRKAAPTRKKKWYEFAEEAHQDIIEQTEGPR